MRRLLSLTAIAVVVLAVTNAWVKAQGPGEKPLKPFMQMKLEPAKQILEGIALEDFDLINRSAQRISALTFDAGWMTIQTASYRQHSEDFQRSVAAIAQAARNKNLNAATLSYMQMTLSCVQCHKDLRSAQP
jgi:hypothetical protein